MKSFRKADSQVKHIIRQANAVGKGRHDHHDDFSVHSVGTARNYEQSLRRLANWMKLHKFGNLQSLNNELATAYLNERKRVVKQSTLDQDRQAIQVCLKEKLPVIKSERATQLHSRIYTNQQVEMVAKAQTPANGQRHDLVA